MRHAMDNADYHAHPAISKSRLDQIARSPLHYWARYLDPKREPTEPTAAMRLGTAVHTMVLEQDQWDNRYITAPAIDRRTKAGKEAWSELMAEAGDRELISIEDRAIVSRMAESVWLHPAAAALLHWQGKAETTHMWTDAATGLECKCRPDWLTNDGKLIVDVKTTEDASPRGFQKSIGAYRYFVQASWYLDGVEATTGQRPEQFLFLAIEKKPPYAVAVYAADAEMIELGQSTAARDLDVLATCKDAGVWPGYSDQIETISLPPWMRPRPDGTTMPTPTEIEMY